MEVITLSNSSFLIEKDTRLIVMDASPWNFEFKSIFHCPKLAEGVYILKLLLESSDVHLGLNVVLVSKFVNHVLYNKLP